MNDWLKDYRPICRNELLDSQETVAINSHWRHTVLPIGATITAVSNSFATLWDGQRRLDRPITELIGPRAEWLHIT